MTQRKRTDHDQGDDNEDEDDYKNDGEIDDNYAPKIQCRPPYSLAMSLHTLIITIRYFSH